MATIKIPAQKIELGSEVKDPITGIKGIVTCIAWMMRVDPRVAVQPQKSKDGKPADLKFYDWGRLTSNPVPEEPEPKLIGDIGYDELIPELKGVVISHHLNFKGCAFVEIQPTKLIEGKAPETHIIDTGRYKSNNPTPAKVDKGPGGPYIKQRASR
ncbi:hypothetical protein [Acinetobacter sp.]|uniref:hypothetical protein n=1 Tax=Acinetobacter sp. TaxID=472 RepID=UPI0037509F21